MKSASNTRVAHNEQPEILKNQKVPGSKRQNGYNRFVFLIVFVLGFGLLTSTACRQNTGAFESSPEIAGQQNSESNNNTPPTNTAVSTPVAETIKPPKVYQNNCARCHGKNAEGKEDYPPLTGVTTRAEDPYSDEQLLEIINNAKEFGLNSKMPSFQNKLSEAEKLEIINWLKALK